MTSSYFVTVKLSYSLISRNETKNMAMKSTVLVGISIRLILYLV